MTNLLTYIIADDDLIYRELTLQQLQLIPHLQCLAVCQNAMEVVSELSKQPADLLILDVEMPGLTGIQLAKSLTKLPLIIFISSHLLYAVDAYEVDAIDYLVKPVTPERLIRAIEKARSLHEMKNSMTADEAIKNVAGDHFFIKDKSSYIKILYSDVVYIQSLGDFVNIFLENGDKKIALVSMKSIEQQLPSDNFIRISRSYIVNKTKITSLDNDMVSLNKIQLQIGKTYAEDVIQTIVGGNTVKRFL
ncbi:MAG: response regulator transcription factor [Bacteroidetes bacterium]|nr:response regulator transcription factor [Bacteroidota bacterium]MBS1757170.1 response regulator transcription factor [Bacteroidota bacterium]